MVDYDPVYATGKECYCDIGNLLKILGCKEGITCNEVKWTSG